jgi:SEC-C motif-containing protein
MADNAHLTPDAPCPCGRRSNRRKGQAVTWAACCGPWTLDGAPAPDAESLMRSRYSAFVRGDVDYLLATWHASTRPSELTIEPGVKWLGLEVRAQGMTGTHTAEVEFVARSRQAGRGNRLHERSRFVCEEGRWFYVDGVWI